MRNLLFLLSAIAVNIMSVTGICAQESLTVDSLKSASDSVILQLNNQIRELKLQGIMMQEQLDRSGKNAREDSVQKALTKARIDSLRQITEGAPLSVEGDTLLPH